MRPEPLPDKLCIVIDGTGVPATSKETAGREGKSQDGRARTREVKMAVLFTQDKLDEDGYNAPACATTGSAHAACSSAPASSRQAARPSSCQRLKQSGMQWTVNGAGSIITLGCAQASSQRETICNHRHNQTGAA